MNGVVDNSQTLEFDKINLFLKRRNLSLKGDNSLFQSGDGSSVEIAIDLQYLGIEGINLSLVPALLSLPCIDGRFNVLSLGLIEMSIGLKLNSVCIYLVDFVVESHIVSIKEINLTGKGSNIGIMNQYSSLKFLFVLPGCSKLFLKTSDKTFSICQ